MQMFIDYAEWGVSIGACEHTMAMAESVARVGQLVARVKENALECIVRARQDPHEARPRMECMKEGGQPRCLDGCDVSTDPVHYRHKWRHIYSIHYHHISLSRIHLFVFLFSFPPFD